MASKNPGDFNIMWQKRIETELRTKCNAIRAKHGICDSDLKTMRCDGEETAAELINGRTYAFVPADQRDDISEASQVVKNNHILLPRNLCNTGSPSKAREVAEEKAKLKKGTRGGVDFVQGLDHVGLPKSEIGIAKSVRSGKTAQTNNTDATKARVREAFKKAGLARTEGGQSVATRRSGAAPTGSVKSDATKASAFTAIIRSELRKALRPLQKELEKEKGLREEIEKKLVEEFAKEMRAERKETEKIERDAEERLSQEMR